MVGEVKASASHKPLPANAADMTLARIARLDNKTNGESVTEVGAAMRKAMQHHCGVFRFPELLEQGVTAIAEVSERAQNIQIKDKSKVFNTARVEALELDNLMEVANATMQAANNRQESRGAHARADYAERDDVNWLSHSLYYKQDHQLLYKPVRLKPLTVEPFVPKARTY